MPAAQPLPGPKALDSRGALAGATRFPMAWPSHPGQLSGHFSAQPSHPRRKADVATAGPGACPSMWRRKKLLWAGGLGRGVRGP